MIVGAAVPSQVLPLFRALPAGCRTCLSLVAPPTRGKMVILGASLLFVFVLSSNSVPLFSHMPTSVGAAVPSQVLLFVQVGHAMA